MEKKKELFYGYDIEKMWLDTNLKRIETNILIHLILIAADEKSTKRVVNGNIEYEVPTSLLHEKCRVATGIVGEILWHLQECGYISLRVAPGSTGRKCYHVILSGADPSTKETELIRHAHLIRVENTSETIETFQIRTDSGAYGILYAPRERN